MSLFVRLEKDDYQQTILKIRDLETEIGYDNFGQLNVGKNRSTVLKIIS